MMDEDTLWQFEDGEYQYTGTPLSVKKRNRHTGESINLFYGKGDALKKLSCHET